MNIQTVKALFEDIYKDSDYLDNQNDERYVRNSLDSIESQLFHQEDISFMLYPNIPIVHLFIEKWNITPVKEGKKWIVLYTDNNEEKLQDDMDAYDDEFSIFRTNDKTYDFYEKVFKNRDINISSYQYPSYYRTPEKTLSNKVYEDMKLKSIDTDELIKELKSRQLSKKDITELQKLI